MKNFLRILAALFALCLLLTACGKGKTPESLTPDEPQSLTPDESQSLTPDEPQSQKPDGPISNNAQILVTDAPPLAELEAKKRDHYDNGTYYYMDVAGENALRCINSCYQTTIRAEETEEEYAQRRAIGLSVALTPGNPYNLTVGKDDALSEALGYPVYLVSFLTGSDLNTSCWTVYLTRTEHYSYQYAFCIPTQTSLQMEDKMMEYFGTLKLTDLPQQ